MRFRHVRLHPAALARAQSAAWRSAVRVECPLCDQPYYAATLLGLWQGVTLDALRILVQTHLARECPDHPHVFEW